MKRFILGSLTVSFFIAQPSFAAKGDKLSEVQQVIEFNGLKKDKIYNGSRQWVATKFRSAQNVIQMDDKENGIIIGKGNFNYPCSGWQCLSYDGHTVQFTVKIEAKDNKARITFNDLVHHIPSKFNAGVMSPQYDFPVEQSTKYDNVTPVKLKFDEIIQDYKNSVLSTSTSNDNW